MTRREGPAVVAALLAAASALVSLYWFVGGTAGLAGLGGELERLARERSSGALAVLAAVIVAKLVAVALAWALTRSPVPRAVALIATWGGGALGLYGLLLTAGGVVGLVIDADGADRHALWSHTLVWDPWFAVWGIALAVAGRRSTSRTF